MKNVTVEVSSLTNQALNWAVAIAEGYKPFEGEITSLVIYSIKHGGTSPIVSIKDGKVVIINNEKKVKNGIYSPSSDENRLAKIKSQFQIEVKQKEGIWIAVSRGDKKAKNKVIVEANGVSKAEAIAKVFVLAKMGEGIELPEVLVEEPIDQVKIERMKKLEFLKKELSSYSAESLLEKFEHVGMNGPSLTDFLDNILLEEENV